MSEMASNSNEPKPALSTQPVQPVERSEKNAQPSQTSGGKANYSVFWVTGIIALALLITLAALIYPMPAPARTFTALAAGGVALIIGGLVFLVLLIPAAGSNPDVKTEFYSARAAYLCVISGLAVFLIVAVGAVIARVLLTARGH